MKKMVAAMLTGVLCVGVLGFCPTQSSAKTKSQSLFKNLKGGQTYSYDLDGDGTNEKISYTTKILKKNGYDEKTKVTISINGHKAFAKTIKYVCNPTVTVCDINQKDKSKELVLIGNGDSDCLFYFNMFHYNAKNKLFSIMDTKKELRAAGKKMFRINFNKKCVPGNGKFTIWSDTPYFYETGCYWIKTDFKLKKDQVKNVSPKTCQIEVPACKDVTLTGYCKLKKDVQGYKSASVTKKSFVIKKGEQVQPIGIRIINSKKAVLKVKTNSGKKSGKTAWIKIKKTDALTYLFESVPAWS